MSIQSVIEKVQKLLALANSSNPNEAATAAAVANKLIDQYRLNESDIQDSSNMIVEDQDPIYTSGRVTRWKSMLVGVLAHHYGVAHYISATYPEGRKISNYKLVGRKSDIEVTRYMFSWLLNECQRLAIQQTKGLGKIFISSYCEGFVTGVSLQLKASRQEATKDASNTAIVQLNSRLKDSRAFMYQSHNLKTSKYKSNNQIDHNAFSAGQKQGQNVHLGQSLGSQRMRLLGT